MKRRRLGGRPGRLAGRDRVTSSIEIEVAMAVVLRAAMRSSFETSKGE